jgi:hypothetical protein
LNPNTYELEQYNWAFTSDELSQFIHNDLKRLTAAARLSAISIFQDGSHVRVSLPNALTGALSQLFGMIQ